MTVVDFIERLKNYPKDYKVYIQNVMDSDEPEENIDIEIDHDSKSIIIY